MGVFCGCVCAGAALFTILALRMVTCSSTGVGVCKSVAKRSKGAVSCNMLSGTSSEIHVSYCATKAASCLLGDDVVNGNVSTSCVA